MFTINIYLKFALIALFLGLGIVLIFTQGFWYAFPLLLVGLLLLLSYFLLGTVQSASQMVQAQDFDGAEKRLNLTIKPDWLYVTNRAYYYIMKGSVAAGRNDIKGSEVFFNQALELNLPSDNEKGMVLLQLAGINANKGKWTEAKNYFNRAKKLKITEPQIKSQFDMLQKALGNQGQMKAARSMGKQGMNMMNRGSKRRRPKMR